jgi:hypothetical protein
MDQYERWASTPINTERGARYIRPVQSTTLAKCSSLILAFLGYVHKYFKIPHAGLSLSVGYSDPRKIAHFVAYLQARNVNRGHIVKHLGLARKVNNYLQSGTDPASPIRVHADKMERWLSTLEAQVYASMPATVKENVPEAAEIWAWAIGLADQAIMAVELDMEELGCISEGTAWQVERALITSLVTGCFTPPCRLR